MGSPLTCMKSAPLQEHSARFQRFPRIRHGSAHGRHVFSHLVPRTLLFFGDSCKSQTKSSFYSCQSLQNLRHQTWVSETAKGRSIGNTALTPSEMASIFWQQHKSPRSENHVVVRVADLFMNNIHTDLASSLNNVRAEILGSALYCQYSVRVKP